LLKSNIRGENHMPHSIGKAIIGICLGAALGFGYYKLVGCSSGACPLTSNPIITTLYGAFMGAVISWG
jgi:Family of unknown function (DUF6132)